MTILALFCAEQVGVTKPAYKHAFTAAWDATNGPIEMVIEPCLDLTTNRGPFCVVFRQSFPANAGDLRAKMKF